MNDLSQNLTVLYVGTLPPHTGGTAILSFQLLVGLARLGHSIRAIAPITEEKLQSRDTFAEQYPEVNVFRFAVPYFESSPDVPPSDAYRQSERKQIQETLSGLIENKQPDIIIIGRETFVWHVPDVAIANRIPTVLLIQGGTTAGILKGTIPDAMAKKMLEQFRKTNLMIVVAKHLGKTMKQLLKFNNIRVIQNTIDVHRFLPQPKNERLLRKLGINKGDIVVAHISNLKPLKRPLDLVNSAIVAVRQNPKLVYVIVGEGSLREKMEETCRQNRVSNRFRFVGWVDYQYVPDYINLADIVVMPSEAEALALVYLETQACGRVLLASDIPAAKEAIMDRETGLLFSKGDIDDLTAKTLLAAGDNTLRSEMGRKARKSVQAYPLNELVNEYDATLKEVVQHNSS